MAELVNLKAYRIAQIEKKGFGPWRKRFNEPFQKETCLADLSDLTLYRLAEPGENAALPYYEIIMGTLDWGNPVKFYYLDDAERMRVIDIHLFLADQVRFEMMKRLGWIEKFANEHYALISYILSFDHLRMFCQNHPPHLAPTHPRFAEYNAMVNADKQVFIRRLLPQALEVFQTRIAPE
ncbi:MAG: hypothetical protein ACOZF0_01360 [Thermodesulfobacteriota bacterium]